MRGVTGKGLDMILIKLEGGLVQGVFSTDPKHIGQSAVISDYDPDSEGEEVHGICDVFKDGRLSHISAVDIEALDLDIACQFWESRPL